ncbi:hypothetical protein SAMCCGM7_Ch3534 [Sinorhizobium americanum CCGM7]|nr:hypothetical protein SAMCCGM7_Ch3534 [Sinorhizobium americanum CCGM7]
MTVCLAIPQPVPSADAPRATDEKSYFFSRIRRQRRVSQP